MQAGDVIDSKYRIEAQLGEGGMGVVFAATHVTLDATFAIKVLKKDALAHPEVPRRFMREARAASRLRNEHVMRVSDIGQLASGEPYMVMEMLHGYDLATRLQQKGRVEPERAVEYIMQACEGLAEAHAFGMVHRDVKPANLFVTTRPNGAPLVKVLDFGIATAGIGDVDHRLTTTQSVIGSPSYMSPEQLRATKDVDARSDIWSLGVTLYELLADRQPFSAPTITALSLKIVGEPHMPIDGLPEGLMAILDRCLEKERDARFSTVAELAAALSPYAPNGRLAAEMVSGVLSNPVPPTIDTPASASLPSATTTGFTAGESAALVPARRRRGRTVGFIALAAAAAAGGIVTAMVLGFSSRGASPAAAPAMTGPPAIIDAPPPPLAAPVVGPPKPAVAVEEPKPEPPAKPTKPPKKPTKPTRPAKPSTPVAQPPTPIAQPPVVEPPKPPVVEPKPEPPKKPTPCDPRDKTCGL